MSLSVRETRYFVFDRRTVSWANSYYIAGVHSRSVYIIENDAVSLFIGIRKPAGDLLNIVCFIFIHEAERNDVFITLLFLHLRIVQSVPQHSRRSTCFESAYRKTKLTQILSQFTCRRHTGWSGNSDIIPDKDLSSEECTGAYDHSVSRQCPAVCCCDSCDASSASESLAGSLFFAGSGLFIYNETGYLTCYKVKTILLLYGMKHLLMISVLIGLCSE